MDLGNNIQKYRKEAGLTQKELAEILNVAVGTIQQYELGKRQPRLEMINRIAGALGIGVRRLYPDFQYEDWEKTETYKNARLTNTLDPLRGELLSKFQELNASGKVEAVKRVSELTEIPRYTKPDMPDTYNSDVYARTTRDSEQELYNTAENKTSDPCYSQELEKIPKPQT